MGEGAAALGEGTKRLGGEDGDTGQFCRLPLQRGVDLEGEIFYRVSKYSFGG